jgi:hypothetical protein
MDFADGYWMTDVYAIHHQIAIEKENPTNMRGLSWVGSTDNGG